MKIIVNILLKSFIYIVTTSLIVVIIVSIYLTGLIHGYNFGKSDTEIKFVELVNDQMVNLRKNTDILPSPTPASEVVTPSPIKIYWGGPELWSLVNKRRIELGVNALKQKDELCTIASIRLNELLELEKLDGHEGFGDLNERRKDLSWIFERYSTIAEFLAMGGITATDTVSMWENTLAHKKILDGGEFVWGCIYAQESFAVGITAY